MWYFYFWYAVAAGCVVGFVIGFVRELRDSIREHRQRRFRSSIRKRLEDAGRGCDGRGIVVVPPTGIASLDGEEQPR